MAIVSSVAQEISSTAVPLCVRIVQWERTRIRMIRLPVLHVPRDPRHKLWPAPAAQTAKTFVTLDTIKQEQDVIPVGWASTRASLGCSTVTHVLWVRPHEGPLLLLHLSATMTVTQGMSCLPTECVYSVPLVHTEYWVPQPCVWPVPRTKQQQQRAPPKQPTAH